MTPEQDSARKKRAVSAARSLLMLETSIATGAKRVHNALRHMGEEVPALFPVFGKFLESIPASMPLGEVRLLCEEAFLFKSDKALAIIESKYRPALLLGCLAVIRTYGDGTK